jgi:enterochelin esterase-like enzyme
MKKRFLVLISLLAFFGCTSKQPARLGVSAMEAQLVSLSSQPAAFQATLDSLKLTQGIPYVVEDSVLFIYAGEADSVAWAGDWNRWGNEDSERSIGVKVAENLFTYKRKFDPRSRFDYKIVVDGEWMLDPGNLHEQYSGFGPNSELRMGSWELDPITIERPDITKGTLTEVMITESAAMGYKVAWQVYVPPAGLEPPYRVIYVTDGQQYSDPLQGNLPTVLDNLHADGAIGATMAVFIDPRDPDTGENRRRPELVLHQPFQDFIDKELIPLVDSTYQTIDTPEGRAIMGTSLGGLNATYTLMTLKHRFAFAGAHSPAYRYNDSHEAIFEMARNHDFAGQRIIMNSGNVFDTEVGAREMVEILRSLNVDYKYYEVPESHSWGNWRAFMDEMVLGFWGVGVNKND